MSTTANNRRRLTDSCVGGFRSCRRLSALWRFPGVVEWRSRHHVLGRDDLVGNAHLSQQPRRRNPMVRARPASPRQRGNDARYTVVTDGMVRTPEQRCDLRRRAHQRHERSRRSRTRRLVTDLSGEPQGSGRPEQLIRPSEVKPPPLTRDVRSGPRRAIRRARLGLLPRCLRPSSALGGSHAVRKSGGRQGSTGTSRAGGTNASPAYAR